jgi:hypothetical protein
MSGEHQPPWPDVAAALDILGLDPDVTWPNIRLAYRDLVRACHPDLDVANDAAATERTAALNVAFDTLAAATDGGRIELRAPLDGSVRNPPEAASTSGERVTLQAPPGDVFIQLLDAAHEIGEVSYMDPEAGLIQVLLQDGDPTASQLLIAVDQRPDPPTVSFTLDTVDAESAPPIRDIVDALALALRS